MFAEFRIPNLVFENRTRLDALQFDAVDQHDTSFHVIVAKTAYLLGPRDGAGNAALTPVPGARLNVEDRAFDDSLDASVRQESDFAPYKPACDVIVNATAHAPGGKPANAFQVSLTVRGVESAPLIDKTLDISGERSFQKKMALWRMVQWTGKVASAGLLQPNPWRISLAQPATSLPLRYAYANGGECRIDPGDASGAAAAHESSEENPCGRGFTRRWYMGAKPATQFAAPRIHASGTPLTAHQFWQAAHGTALPAPAGMGVVGRGWLPRRALAGTFDDKAAWGEDDVPRLPLDFDFAYYNCAPRDQQCAYLGGQEKFSLLNLCSPNHPSAAVDAKGSTVLQFTLPQQALFLLAVDGSDMLLVERLVIDTVTIEPDENRVDLVWRALLPTDADLRVARLMHVSEAAQIARVDEMIEILAALARGAAAGGQAESAAQ
jgi:hypothetical protein